MKRVELVFDEELFKNNENVGIQSIDFVADPAMGEIWVHYSNQHNNKTNDEKRLLAGPILIPGKKIPRFDEETGEESTQSATAEVIEQYSQDYMRKGRQANVNREHTTVKDDATLVETWIVGENDKSKDFGYDLPLGTWFGIYKVESDKTWTDVKNGKIKGFSINGLLPTQTVNFTAEYSTEENMLSELTKLIELSEGESILQEIKQLIDKNE